MNLESVKTCQKHAVNHDANSMLFRTPFSISRALFLHCRLFIGMRNRSGMSLHSNLSNGIVSAQLFHKKESRVESSRFTQTVEKPENLKFFNEPQLEVVAQSTKLFEMK